MGEYRAKMILFPKDSAKKKAYVSKSNPDKKRRPEPVATEEERKTATQRAGDLFPIQRKQPVSQQKRSIKPEELLAKNSQYLRARRARADAKLVGERVRRAEIRAKKAEESAAGGGKKTKHT